MSQCVRLYGCFEGHGSLATVTDGWLYALQSADMLAGCAMTSAMHDQTRAPPGGDKAPVAIVTDVRQLGIAGFFRHTKTYVVLATHTCWMPDDMIALLRVLKAEVLAPSARVMGQMQEIAPDVPVHLVAHGVSPGFRPLTAEERAQLPASSLYRGLRGPGMAFLHMVESHTDRKGTYPLLEAFEACLRDGMDASLTVVSTGLERMRMATHVADNPVLRNRVMVLPRIDALPDKLRWVYSCFDAIVQPSRSEGFGLCPLEALCSGVPAIFTVNGIGHDEWAAGLDMGCVPFPLGPDGPTEFDPAPAPTIEPAAIAMALQHAYKHRDDLRAEILEGCQEIARQWAWPHVTKPFLSHLEREFSP